MEIEKLQRICASLGSLDTERIISSEATDFLKEAGNCLADSLIQLRSLLKISIEANSKVNVETGSCIPVVSPIEIAEADDCIGICVHKLLSICDVVSRNPSNSAFLVRRSSLSEILISYSMM